MSRLGFKSVVYHGDLCLGELDAIPVSDQNFQFPNNEIRIHHVSPPSERCPPLSILQTISSFSVRCKLESSLPVEQSHLINLHAMCFYELKVATQSISFVLNFNSSIIFIFVAENVAKISSFLSVMLLFISPKRL
jgi:hypothetical protein